MSKSQPIERRSARVSNTSSVVSPKPSIRPLLVRISGCVCLDVLEHREADLVLALPPHVLLQPGDGLEVVVEHIGPGVENDVDQLASPVEVGREHLDRRAGPLAHCQHAAAEVLGAAVIAGRRGSRR